ncbi:Sec-independent protein translocase subunit TatA [Lolliginicoccus suaedae]|uniref:Sec-independent protein translocase subunit TatA n=1 Tax=Lolliginicoccus suaedae TaxID=2605429 RepID=UPI0011ECF113|nr:Sec-independent protein translocase subunit TatA [Lolliginicoccus suaedae]
MGFTSPWHWLILILVIVVLFGSKRLPDAARGLGRSMRIFKSEIKEMGNDGSTESAKQPPQSAPPQINAAPSEPDPSDRAQGSYTQQGNQQPDQHA